MAIAAQSAWAGVLVLSGTFRQIIDYTAFAVVLFAGVAVAALFVLRFREPDAHRPFRAWGIRRPPLVFVLVSAAIVINAIRLNPGPSLAGIVLIGAGIPSISSSSRDRDRPAGREARGLQAHFTLESGLRGMPASG